MRKSRLTRPRRWSITASSAARKRSRSKRVDELEPVARRAVERAALEGRAASRSRGRHRCGRRARPSPRRVAGAGQRQRLALGVADQALRERAAGEGVLHDGEADQHDDQHQAAGQRRLRRGRWSSWPVTVKPAATTQTSSRTQVGISMMARSKPWMARIDDQHEADDRERRRSRCGRRRRRPAASTTATPTRAARPSSQSDRHVAVADMPAVEVADR